MVQPGLDHHKRGQHFRFITMIAAAEVAVEGKDTVCPGKTARQLSYDYLLVIVSKRKRQKQIRSR